MATRSTKLSGHGNRKSWGSRTNPPQFAMGSPVVSDDEVCIPWPFALLMSRNHGINPCKQRLDADTILVAQLRGRSQQASESQVKSHLKEEANTVAAKPENSLVYANVRGFSVLDDLENFKRELKDQRLQLENRIEALESEAQKSQNEARGSKNRIEALESEARESKTKIDTQDHNLLALQDRVTDLTLISEGYFAIRMRFLDIYNKKVKRDPAFQQTPEIESGNMRAHDGDAKVDATLFRDQKRPKDPKTYKELYGVDHSKTLGFGTYIENSTDIFHLQKATNRQHNRRSPL